MTLLFVSAYNPIFLGVDNCPRMCAPMVGALLHPGNDCRGDATSDAILTVPTALWRCASRHSLLASKVHYRHHHTTVGFHALLINNGGACFLCFFKPSRTFRRNSSLTHIHVPSSAPLRTIQ
jgi:hypothetical protein